MARNKSRPEKAAPAPTRVRLSTKEISQNEKAGFQEVRYVAEGYAITQVTKLDHEVRVLIQSPGARWKREYAPAVDPYLVQDFAKVRDESTLLDFAHRYGQLGHWVHVEPDHRCGGDPVHWAIAHARRVSAIKDTLEMISEATAGKIGNPGSPKVMERLRQPIDKVLRIAGVEPAPMGRLEYDGKPIPGLTQISIGATLMTVNWPSNPIQTAYEAIANMVNPIIQGIHYKVGVSTNESRLVLQYQSLLQIIYWRVASQLRGVWRRCKRTDCVQVFSVTDPRQQHCSARCRNLHKQKEFRRRQRSTGLADTLA